MSAYGNTGQTTPQQVYNYFSAADPQALKSPKDLQKALGQYAQSSQWQPAGATSSTGAAGVVDPLAVQMFFSSTMAPYMQQIAGNEKATADQLRSQPTLSGLPASYAATVKQGETNQANDMDMLMQATQAAASTQPQVAMLNQMLGLQQKAALQDYYRQLAAGTGGTAATPPPTGGF
jgi:hypothetical protein